MNPTATNRPRTHPERTQLGSEASGRRWKAAAKRAWFYGAMCKPRIVGLLLLTTGVSYMVASRGVVAVGPFAFLMAGGALAAAGAAMVNNFLDRDLDALMLRTRRRPLASKAIAHPKRVLGVGIASIFVGVLMGLLVSPVVAGIIATGSMVYVLLYTVVLKRRTHWNVVVGGLSGSCAVSAGWLAGASLSMAAVLVATLLFTWQLAHSWALALAHRHDYERAGIPQLPAVAGHRRTAGYVLLAAVVTVGVSLAFGVAADLAMPYFAGSLVLAALWLGVIARLLANVCEQTAWRAFKVSGIYLAGVFSLMLLDIALAIGS